MEELPAFPSFPDLASGLPRPPTPSHCSPWAWLAGDSSSGLGLVDEVMSVTTDASDDEAFILVEAGDGGDDVFGDAAPVVDVAEEAEDALPASPTPRGSHLLERVLGEEVSVVRVELGGAELILGGSGEGSVIRLDAAALRVAEEDRRPLREALAGLGSRPPPAPLPARPSTAPFSLHILARGLGTRSQTTMVKPE